MIAGVCSGLANYLSVDVTIIRLVFVLLLFTMTGGFWIYIALWIIVPIEPSAQSDSVDVRAELASETPKKVAAPKKLTEKPLPPVKSKNDDSGD